MKTLRQLFDQYGSDKNRSGYTPIYASIFDHLRFKRMDILEIGIGTLVEGADSNMRTCGGPGYRPGASLRAWRDFFPAARVYGVDIQDDCMFEEDRIATFKFDSSCDKRACDQALGGMTFEIIIDDGCHESMSQIHTFWNLWDRVRPLGFYIIEDVVAGQHLWQNWHREFATIKTEKWTNEQRNLIVFHKGE